MSNRPIGVTLLAILAALAAAAMAVNALQFLGVIPPILGAVAFFGVSPLGAVLCAACAAIFGWLAVALWRLRPAAWMYTWLFAGVALVVAALAVLGASTLSAMLPTLIINGIILAYCFTPGVKRAFASS
jgi:hypothetical protein